MERRQGFRILGLDFIELVEVGLEDIALQGQISEFSLAGDCDESSCLQFLDVVLEGRSADRLALAHGRAGYGAAALADPAKDLEAPWIG